MLKESGEEDDQKRDGGCHKSDIGCKWGGCGRSSFVEVED